MSDLALEDIEAGLRHARTRAAVLADDVANARTPGFVARDASMVPSGEGPAFATVLHRVGAEGTVAVLEFAMGAQAKNAATYRALAEQERAMLRELRTVAEEARR